MRTIDHKYYVAVHLGNKPIDGKLDFPSYLVCKKCQQQVGTGILNISRHSCNLIGDRREVTISIAKGIESKWFKDFEDRVLHIKSEA